MRGSRWMLAGLLVAAPLQAQGEIARGYLFKEPPLTITVYGGLAQPRASGDIWAFTFDQLTVAPRDLRTREIGGDVAIRLATRLDLVFSFSVNDVSTRSEMRDWVDQDGLPIRQSTRFIRRPYSVAARYHLRAPGRALGNHAWVPNRVVPFVGLGVGRMSYSLDQQGDFVDEETLDVFTDQYRADGRALFAQASVGSALNLLPSVALTAEARYLWAGGDGRPSFTGFDRLDLSGLSTQVGLSLRLK